MAQTVWNFTAKWEIKKTKIYAKLKEMFLSSFIRGDEGLPYSVKVGECPQGDFLLMSASQRDKHLKAIHPHTGSKNPALQNINACLSSKRINMCEDVTWCSPAPMNYGEECRYLHSTQSTYYDGTCGSWVQNWWAPRRRGWRSSMLRQRKCEWEHMYAKLRGVFAWVGWLAALLRL